MEMKILPVFIRGGILCAVLAATSLVNLAAEPANPAVLGQWDFDGNDLRATVGSPLEFRGDTAAATTFETVFIDGVGAKAMRYPGATPAQGFILRHTGGFNGGGTNLNQFTLIMDVFWPAESDGTFRALLNTDPGNTEDAVMFVNPDGAVGVNNNYGLELPVEQWHRLVLAFDLASGVINKYLVGPTNVTASVQTLEGPAVDSRFSLGGTALLFADNDGETAPGLVNSIQLRSGVITAEEVEDLGPATAGGIDGEPPPLEDVKITSVRKEGSNLIITASGGGRLQLQKKVHLKQSAWQPEGDPSNTGTFTVPITDPTSYFRLLRL